MAFAAPRSPDPQAPVGRRQKCEGAVGLQARWREPGGCTLPCQPQERTPGEEEEKEKFNPARNQQQKHSTPVFSQQAQSRGELQD